MIVDGTVGALIAAAHLANVEHVQLERLDDGLVEAFGRVVVVDADGQVTRHVGHRPPADRSELYANVIRVQVVVVKNGLRFRKKYLSIYSVT